MYLYYEMMQIIISSNSKFQVLIILNRKKKKNAKITKNYTQIEQALNS